MEAILRGEKIVKTFGRSYALGWKDTTVGSVNVEFFPGQICGIVGPNGSGKSTLLDTLSGLCVLDQGRILLKGRDVTDVRPSKIAELGLARTFQLPRYLPANLSSAHDITGLLLRKARGSTWTIPWEALGLELAGRASARLSNLEFAVRLQPQVLLLDEPLTSLDEKGVNAVARLIRDAKTRGCAVVLVDHHLEEVRRLADCIYFLQNGKVRSGEHAVLPEVLWNDETFKRIMLSGSLVAKDELPEASVPTCQHSGKGSDGRIVIRGLRAKCEDFELDVEQQLSLGVGVHLVQGSTGSGKTLLLSALMGALPRLKVEGLRFPQDPPSSERSRWPELHELTSMGIRWAPEDAPHSASLTVEEVLKIARPGRRTQIGNIQFERGYTLNNLFPELVNACRRYPHELSGGALQMLNLARAFLRPCRAVFLDRPFQNLDHPTQARVAKYINDIADRTIIVIVGYVEGSVSLPKAASVINCEEGKVRQGS